MRRWTRMQLAALMVGRRRETSNGYVYCGTEYGKQEVRQEVVWVVWAWRYGGFHGQA